MTKLTALDRLEIIELQSIYAWALDRREFSLLSQAFTDDIVGIYPLAKPIVGLEAFSRYMETFHAPHDGTQHLISNPWIVEDGDEVIFRSYVIGSMTIEGQPGGHLLQGGGYYIDRVVRTDDGWRIAEREVINVWRDGNPDVVKVSRDAVGKL